LTHPQIGRDLLDKFAEKIKEHGVVERPPLLEGKSMHISVASTHKPKSHEPTPAAAAKAQTQDAEAAVAGEAPTGDDRAAEAPSLVAPAEIETAPTLNEAKPARPASRSPSRKAGPASTGE
jgi:hypothetical protein